MTNFFPILKATTVKGFSWQKKKKKERRQRKESKKILRWEFIWYKIFCFFRKKYGK